MVSADEKVISDVSITDLHGRIVCERANSEAQNLMRIELADLPPGMYFVKMKAGEIVHTEKLFIH
jgi:hypothetical protein